MSNRSQLKFQQVNINLLVLQNRRHLESVWIDRIHGEGNNTESGVFSQNLLYNNGILNSNSCCWKSFFTILSTF